MRLSTVATARIWERFTAKRYECPGAIRTAAAAVLGAAAAAVTIRGLGGRGRTAAWGGGGGNQPPDLEDLIRRGQDRLRKTSCPAASMAAPS